MCQRAKPPAAAIASPQRGSFRSRSSTHNESLLHIDEFPRARPSLAVQIAQFYSSQIPLIREARVDAHLDVAELRDGACGQGEMCS